MQQRVLVLCDDYWHPAKIVRDGLEALPDSQYTFDFSQDARDWSAEAMAGCPLVILAKSNNVSSSDQSAWMTEAVQTAFADYVRQGGGLLALHSGTAGYSEAAVLRALLGGVFTQHPPQCPVTVTPHPGHPLTAGSSPFTLPDEHYGIALDDPHADVFMTTTSEHGSQPGGWTRSEGMGRVGVLTPGHNLAVWVEPAYQTLLSSALSWCERSA